MASLSAVRPNTGQGRRGTKKKQTVSRHDQFKNRGGQNKDKDGEGDWSNGTLRESLPYKQEGLSLDPQDPVKSGTSQYVCNTSMGAGMGMA